MKYAFSLAVLFFSFSSLAQAEGGGNGFLDAAERYDKQAAAARAAGKVRAAEILERMAEIKREAADHQGGEFDWSEYFALQKQLHQMKKGGKAHKKQPHNKGDNGFIKAAQEYAAKANQAKEEGDEVASRIYTRLAAIKIDAAAKASQGESFDWSEYHALKAQLAEHLAAKAE